MTTLLDAVHQLDASLIGLADALQRGDVAAVLDCETSIADALAVVASADRSPADRHALSRAIDAVRLSIARCRALGQASQDLLDIVAPPATYSRS
jgi:hypothetical protein